jgi:ACT domain-containing protein
MKKTERIEVLLSTTQKAEIDEVCKKLGISQSSYFNLIHSMFKLEKLEETLWKKKRK